MRIVVNRLTSTVMFVRQRLSVLGMLAFFCVEARAHDVLVPMYVEPERPTTPWGRERCKSADVAHHVEGAKAIVQAQQSRARSPDESIVPSTGLEGVGLRQGLVFRFEPLIPEVPLQVLTHHADIPPNEAIGIAMQLVMDPDWPTDQVALIVAVPRVRAEISFPYGVMAEDHPESVYRIGMGFPYDNFSGIPPRPLAGLTLARPHSIHAPELSPYVILIARRRDNGELESVSPETRARFGYRASEPLQELGHGSTNIVFRDPEFPAYALRVNGYAAWSGALNNRSLGDIIRSLQEDQLRRAITRQTVAQATLNGRRFIEMPEPMIRSGTETHALQDRVGVAAGTSRVPYWDPAHYVELAPLQNALDLLRLNRIPPGATDVTPAQRARARAFEVVLRIWMNQVLETEGRNWNSVDTVEEVQELERKAFQAALALLRHAQVLISTDSPRQGWITMRELQDIIRGYATAMRDVHGVTTVQGNAEGLAAGDWPLTHRSNLSFEVRQRAAMGEPITQQDMQHPVNNRPIGQDINSDPANAVLRIADHVVVIGDS